MPDGSQRVGISEYYSYDAYGVMVDGNPTSASPAQTNMLYAGEQWDNSAQMYYLRARYYDPLNGRFNQVDPYAGNNEDPQSLHKYLYCHANPVNAVDPTGELTMMQFICVMAIIGAIIGAIVGGVIAKVYRGLSITEPEFWAWVAGGAIIGASIAAIAAWALIKFGLITVTAAGGTVGTGAASNINWLCDNAQRAWHIVRPEHLWYKIVSALQNVNFDNALQMYNTYVLPILQKVVNDPKTIQTMRTLTNGAQKIIYTGVYNGYTIVINIWLSPNGQKLIEDAWVL